MSIRLNKTTLRIKTSPPRIIDLTLDDDDDKKPPSKRAKTEPECEACGGVRWWCRGCGRAMKKQAMEAAGLDKYVIGDVLESQWGECDSFFLPCFLCNKRGLLPPTGCDPIATLPDFWVLF